MILSEATTSCEAAVQKARGAVLSPASYESGIAERNVLRTFNASTVRFKVMLFHTMTIVTLTIVFLCRDSGLFK